MAAKVVVQTWTIKRPPEGMRTPIATIEGLTSDPKITVVDKDPTQFLVTVDRRKPTTSASTSAPVFTYRIWLEIAVTAPIADGDTLSFAVNGSRDAPYDVLQGLCLVDSLTVVEVRDPNLPRPDNVVPSVHGSSAHTYKHVLYPERDGASVAEGAPAPFAQLLLSGGSSGGAAGNAYAIDIDEEDTADFPDGVSVVQSGRVVTLQMANNPRAIHATRAQPQTKNIFTSIQDIGLSTWTRHVLTALADPVPSDYQNMPGTGAGAGIVPAFDVSANVTLDVFSFVVEPTPGAAVPATVSSLDPRFAVRQVPSSDAAPGRFVVSLQDFSGLGRMDFDRGALLQISENGRQFVKPEGAVTSIYLFKPLAPAAIKLGFKAAEAVDTAAGVSTLSRRRTDGDKELMYCVQQSDLPRVDLSLDFDYGSSFVGASLKTLSVGLDVGVVDFDRESRSGKLSEHFSVEPPDVQWQEAPVLLSDKRAEAKGLSITRQIQATAGGGFLTAFVELEIRAWLTSSVSGDTYFAEAPVRLRVYADAVTPPAQIHGGFVDLSASDTPTVLTLAQVVSGGVFDVLGFSDLTLDVRHDALGEPLVPLLVTPGTADVVVQRPCVGGVGRTAYRVLVEFASTTWSTELVLETFRLPDPAAQQQVTIRWDKVRRRAVDGGQVEEACVSEAALADVVLTWSLGDLKSRHLPPGIQTRTWVTVEDTTLPDAATPPSPDSLILSRQVPLPKTLVFVDPDDDVELFSTPEFPFSYATTSQGALRLHMDSPLPDADPGTTVYRRMKVCAGLTYAVNGVKHQAVTCSVLRVYKDASPVPPGPTDLGTCDTTLFPVGTPVMDLAAIVRGGVFDVAHDLNVEVTPISRHDAPRGLSLGELGSGYGLGKSTVLSTLVLDPDAAVLKVDGALPTKDIAAYEVAVTSTCGAALCGPSVFAIQWREPVRVQVTCIRVSGNGVGSTTAVDGAVEAAPPAVAAVVDACVSDVALYITVAGGASDEALTLDFSFCPKDEDLASLLGGRPGPYAELDAQALLSALPPLELRTPVSHAGPPTVAVSRTLELGSPLGPCRPLRTRVRRFAIAAAARRSASPKEDSEGSQGSEGSGRTQACAAATVSLDVFAALDVTSTRWVVRAAVDELQPGFLVVPYTCLVKGGLAWSTRDLHITPYTEAALSDLLTVSVSVGNEGEETPSLTQHLRGCHQPASRAHSGPRFLGHRFGHGLVLARPLVYKWDLVPQVWSIHVVDLGATTVRAHTDVHWVLGDGSRVLAVPHAATTALLEFGPLAPETPETPQVPPVPATWTCPVTSPGGDMHVVLLNGISCSALPSSSAVDARLIRVGDGAVVSRPSRVRNPVRGQPPFLYDLILEIPTAVAADVQGEYALELSVVAKDLSTGGADTGPRQYLSARGHGVEAVEVEEGTGMGMGDPFLRLGVRNGLVRFNLLPDNGQTYDPAKITVNYLGVPASADSEYRDYQVGPYSSVDDTRVFMSNPQGVMTVSAAEPVVVEFESVRADTTTTAAETISIPIPITFVDARGRALGPRLVVHPSQTPGQPPSVESGESTTVPLTDVTAISLVDAEVHTSEDFRLVVYKASLAAPPPPLLRWDEVAPELAGTGYVHRFRTVNNVPVFTDVAANQNLLRRKALGDPALMQFPDSLRLTLAEPVIANERDVPNLLFRLQARLDSGDDLPAPASPVWVTVATNADRAEDSPVTWDALVALLEGRGADGHPWPERTRVVDTAGVYCLWEQDRLLQYRLLVQNSVATRLRAYPLVQVGSYRVRAHRTSTAVVQYTDYQASPGHVIRFFVPDDAQTSGVVPAASALVQAQSRSLKGGGDLMYFETVPVAVNDGYVVAKNGATETHIVDAYTVGPDESTWTMVVTIPPDAMYVRSDVRGIVGGSLASATAMFTRSPESSDVWMCVETKAAGKAVALEVQGSAVRAVFRDLPVGAKVCAVMDTLTM